MKIEEALQRMADAVDKVDNTRVDSQGYTDREQAAIRWTVVALSTLAHVALQRPGADRKAVDAALEKAFAAARPLLPPRTGVVVPLRRES